MNRKFYAWCLFSIILLSSCSHKESQSERSPAQAVAHSEGKAAVLSLPLAGGEEKSIEAKFTTQQVRGMGDSLKVSLASYMRFLGLDPQVKAGFDLLSRLRQSSLQFLVCADLEDWDCLERSPEFKPSVPHRIDAEVNLGQRVDLKEDFSPNVKAYFTQQFLKKDSEKDMGQMMTHQLASIFRGPSPGFKWKSISMALYGIDEIDKSMKNVFDAIIGAKQSGVSVRGVIDIEDVDMARNKPFAVSHIGNVGDSKNLFTPLPPKPPLMRSRYIGVFQYADTAKLLEIINKGVKSEEETLFRVEMPDDPSIMHNKFFVFEGDNPSENIVWTGTTNVSMSCMGREENANMGLVIRNKEIADVFKKEFTEMFDFQRPQDSDYESNLQKLGVWKAPDGGPVRMGRFRNAKRPNTKRYFKFKDDTEMRIHFSPTDDGEHRAIIPMLLSARKGDVIRVAMFGCGGVEYVRAFQYAQAKGAEVKIVVDATTCAVSKPDSWWGGDPKKPTGKGFGVFGALREKNPYGEVDKPIDMRVETWAKFNHHKTGSLSRRLKDGQEFAEVLVVGSQNWSKSGNDENDENMITLRNKKKELEVIKQFNEHFDRLIYPNSVHATEVFKKKK